MKHKLASAIGYKKGDFAPLVLASGRGKIAEQIIAVAEENGVTIMEDAALAALLDVSAKPGDYIPQELWEAAAKVLAFAVKAEGLRAYEY